MKPTLRGWAPGVVKWGMRAGATPQFPVQGALTIERLVLSRQSEA